MSDFKAKMHKIRFSLGLCCRPRRGSLQRCPGPLAVFKGHTSNGWLGSRVVNVLDSDTEGPGFKSQPRLCRVTVLGKLFTHIVPLFTKQRNW